MRLGRRGVGDWVFDMQLRLDDRRLIISRKINFFLWSAIIIDIRASIQTLRTNERLPARLYHAQFHCPAADVTGLPHGGGLDHLGI